jgi:hypothetical protein
MAAWGLILDHEGERTYSIVRTEADRIVQYSAYFAERAEHYRERAMRAPNGCQAEYQLGLAYLFLEMSRDMRLRESAVAPTVQQDQNGMRRCFRRTAEGVFDIRVEHLR